MPKLSKHQWFSMAYVAVIIGALVVVALDLFYWRAG